MLCYFRSHILQADSIEMFDAWILALQRGIGAAIQRTLSDYGAKDENTTNEIINSSSNLSESSKEMAKKRTKERKAK